MSPRKKKEIPTLEIKNQEEANKVISEKLEQAYALIKECEDIADKHECYFSFSLTYGAGATYRPKVKKESGDDWEASSSEDESGWEASSGSC